MHRRPHPRPSAPRPSAPRGPMGPVAGPRGAASELRNKLPFDVVDRYITDLGWRYPNARIPADLQSMRCLWVDKAVDLPLYEVVPLKSDADVVTTDMMTDRSESSTHYVSVMLMLGATESSKLGELHLSRRLKFLAYKDAKGPRFIGGDWSEKDGKKPGEAAYKKTAIRVAKQYGVDLSGCKKWVKFAEFTYERMEGTKCTSHVYIIGDLKEEIVPKTVVEEVPTKVEETQEKEVPLEEGEEGEKKEGEEEKKTKTVKEKVIVEKIIQRPKQRPTACTLQELLTCANEETTLLASSFDEMLTKQYGAVVLDFIKEETTKKRKRQEEEAEEQAKKKQKLEDDKKAAEEKKDDDKKEDKEEDKTEEKKEEKKEEAKPAAPKPKTKWVVTYKQDVLRPCQYIDRGSTGISTGIIKRDAIEGLLARQAEPMCLRAMKAFGEPHGFNYSELATIRTEREVTPEPEPKAMEEDKEEAKEAEEGKEEKDAETKEEAKKE